MKLEFHKFENFVIGNHNEKIYKILVVIKVILLKYFKTSSEN